MTASAGGARRKGEQQRDDRCVPPAPPASRTISSGAGNGSASPWRPRESKRPEARDPACRRPETRCASESRERSLCEHADQGRRQVDRHHPRAALRRLDRQRPGAAAGVEHALPIEIRRQPIEQRAPHLVAAGAHRRPDALDRRVRGQPLPGLDGGAVEIGFRSRRGAAV